LKKGGRQTKNSHLSSFLDTKEYTHTHLASTKRRYKKEYRVLSTATRERER